MIACSVSTSQTNKPTEITLTDEKPIVVLDTGNSDYPRIALYKGGEVIVPDLDVNQNGEIIGVHGATFIAPDGSSIYLYFENGMPVRAIVDDHLIQFENFTGDTVDITFVSPDGTVTQKEKVPFDSNQIPSFGSQSSVHLASMVRTPNNKDIDWFPFIQNATTAFFCAAAVAATIVPSGGTSAVILGAGCAVLAYNTYLAIANKEPPVSVEKANIVISSTGCVHGVAKKDPLAVKDCSDAVIEIVEVVKKETQETEQKLVTMVGGDPNIKSELVIVATVEPISTSASECADLNLTPEECANVGLHIFERIRTCHPTSSCNCDPNQNTNDEVEIEVIFSESTVKLGENHECEATKIAPNIYKSPFKKPISSGGYCANFIYEFNLDGFVLTTPSCGINELNITYIQKK